MKQFNKRRFKSVMLLTPLLLLFLGLQQGFAQKTVSGTVTSEDDQEGLPGVNILIKGTSVGTVSDVMGAYSLEVPGDESVLVFSSVGYVSQEITVGSQSTVNITMAPETTQLGEIVVIGYGTQEKKDVTGSIGTVGQEDFEAQPVVRFDQILQGRAAGVNVTNASGAPGGEVQIRIRGANSINGNNDPLYVIDGFVGANFRDINPTDIETIQVLKDASATAIYGSRGANGVVIITTKTGTKGDSKFSFTGRYYTSKVLRTYDLMDGATFAEVANERADALGSGRPFTDQEIADLRASGGTDWQDELYRTAPGYEFQLDYSGGGENVSYFISGNYLDQDGIILNSDYKRYSIRTNVNADINKWFKANLKLNFIRRENNNTFGDWRNDGPIGGTLAWAPATPARDADGVLTVRDPYSSIKSNPIELAENDRIQETNTFNMFGNLIFEIVDGLTLDVGFGGSYSNRQDKNFSAGSLSNNPTASRQSVENIFLQNTNTLNYTKTFGGDHSVTLTGVVEHQLFQTDQFSATANGLQFPGLSYNNITLAGASSAGAYYEKQTIRSYIGRANYAYRDKYLVTASIRSDGSSKFRDDNRYSTFPAVAVGWRISEEAFMSGGFFDDLKLRGSWGETGSQAIGVYGTVTTFNTSNFEAGTSFLNGTFTPGIIVGNPGNPGLTWETTAQWNVGLDMQILNGRLGLVLDYFDKNTTDLLLSEPVPAYAGGGSIFRNLGEVSNTGFEFSINSTVIDNGDFSWNTNFNASFLTNEVTSIGDREKIFQDGDVGAGLTNLPEMVLIPGNSLSSYWGLNYLGTWKPGEESEAAVYGNVPGDSRYEDINDDGVIGGDDYQIIGSGIPQNLFGWNNTLNWKNFSLNIFFQAMTGYQKWNFAYATAVMANADSREATHTDILDRWQAGVNEDSDIPAFSTTDVSEIQSSRFLEDGDFLRLKNLSLNYNWLVDEARGFNLNFMIAAQNLWTMTSYKGVDPESRSTRLANESSDAQGADGGSYPNAKTWTFGVNLTF
jgi:TonB-linked SusC/RagA family outer membrane protein